MSLSQIVKRELVTARSVSGMRSRSARASNRRRSAQVDDPGAVLGVVLDLDARIVLVEQQCLRVLDLFRLAPLLLEQLEQRVARLGVRLVRQSERHRVDLAV